MKLQKTLSRILDGLILLVFTLFFSSAGFQDRDTTGWYQQWFPNLNSSTIKDITFLDSLTGFAVTTPDASDIGYILKTSNGGDNWFIVHTYPPPNGNVGFTRIKFATDSIGYASTDYLQFFKTTNKGLNWSNISEPPWGIEDMSVVNKDTIFSVSSSGFGGGVYRSTNGGHNWLTIWTNGSDGNPSKIYMFDKKLGFACADYPFSSIFYRTSNGGLNWSNLNDSSFYGIQFLDSNNGWKQTVNSLKKTTNGGLNWIRQNTPVFFDQGFTDLMVINKDTLWYVGSAIYRYNRGLGVICKSSNSGLNWGYQLPDTSIRISRYLTIDFVNKLNGWAYAGTSGVHTITGGNDTTIFTEITNNMSNILSDYQLYQNYPNPFNTSTVISCQLFRNGGRTERAGNSNVSIKIFDVQGHELQTLVQGKLNSGVYEYIFNGNNLSSGIYFYSMIVDGKVLDTKKMLMIK